MICDMHLICKRHHQILFSMIDSNIEMNENKALLSLTYGHNGRIQIAKAKCAHCIFLRAFPCLLSIVWHLHYVSYTRYFRLVCFHLFRMLFSFVKFRNFSPVFRFNRLRIYYCFRYRIVSWSNDIISQPMFAFLALPFSFIHFYFYCWIILNAWCEVSFSKSINHCGAQGEFGTQKNDREKTGK